MADEKKTEFEELESQTGLIGEFIEFLFAICAYYRHLFYAKL